MTEPTSTGLWEQIVHDFVQRGTAPTAEREFFRPDVDRVALVRQALRGCGSDRMTALTLLKAMAVEERQALFPDLIQAARSAHGPVGPVRDLIRSLPRDWVLARIELEVDAVLAGEEYDDYWMFLELYQQLDASRAVRLARRAAAPTDPEIQELGMEWLADLGSAGAGRAV